MNPSEGVKVSLKVMINKENNKVLFAEVDSDFADILISFLTLPLGKVVQLMESQYGVDAPIIGSLTSMYCSVKALDEDHFLTVTAKQILLDPESSLHYSCSHLKINVVDYCKPEMKHFKCTNRDCCQDGHLEAPIRNGRPKIRKDNDDDDSEVFVEKGLSFLITDDLRMSPVVLGGMIQTLLGLGVTIPDGAQLLTVSFGSNEIMDLLRASLVSSTPLTDVVLHQDIGKVDDVIGNFMCHTMEEGYRDYPKKMIVKAWVHKCGTLKNLLFCLQAREDFIDFLLSFLVIPLGGVGWILGGDTGLRNIDNLYRSIRDRIDDKCFTMPDMKSALLNPILPHDGLSKNQLVFALEEKLNPEICCYERAGAGDSSNRREEIDYWFHFKDTKGGNSYVESSDTFVVRDGLVESNGCDYVKKMQQNRSYYKEVELHIGSKEAFNILKASLTSISALTDSLSNLISEKLST